MRCGTCWEYNQRYEYCRKHGCRIASNCEPCYAYVSAITRPTNNPTWRCSNCDRFRRDGYCRGYDEEVDPNHTCDYWKMR